MSTFDQGTSEHQQYLIGTTAGSTVSLSEIQNMLRADPQATIAGVRGQPDNPSRLIVLLTPERAEQLREQYRGELIIEIDATLHPLQPEDRDRG